MERVGLQALVRDEVGKTAARRVRKRGWVPGVLYGRGVEATPVAVELRALRDALHGHGMNVLIDLALRRNGSEETRVVVVKDLQRDIFTHEIIHVDFQAISLEETLEAHVPLVLVGTPRGVVEGGVLEQHLREVLVEALPTAVPEQLTVDVSELAVGQVLHAGDLTVPEGVTLRTPADEVVATVLPPRVEEAPPAAAAAAEAPAAPAAPAPAREEGQGS